MHDFALVENTRAPQGQNPLVAGISLQQNIGYFGKVELMYGIPEIVATHPGTMKKDKTICLPQRYFIVVLMPIALTIITLRLSQ